MREIRLISLIDWQSSLGNWIEEVTSTGVAAAVDPSSCDNYEDSDDDKHEDECDSPESPHQLLRDHEFETTRL